MLYCSLKLLPMDEDIVIKLGADGRLFAGYSSTLIAFSIVCSGFNYSQSPLHTYPIAIYRGKENQV